MNSTTTIDAAPSVRFPIKAFVLTCLIVSIWVNAFEVFRYFAFVMPMMREALHAIPDVAPMNLGVFLIWGVWDTILVAMTMLFYWLYTARFGSSLGSVLAAGTLNWLFFFVLFWLGMMNMRLAQLDMLAIVLPPAWLECVIACGIARVCFRHL
jgi:hypothetical protein